MVAKRAKANTGVYMTVEQYFALDDATDAMYEYENGYVIMLRPPSSAYDEYAPVDMAGGSNAHSALCLRMGSLLDQALSEGPCMVFTSDARLLINEHHHYHPDVMVACDVTPYTAITNPVVVIEVLSPATAKRDRGAKFETYKALPSVQEYVLISSELQAVEVHRREGNFWHQDCYRAGDMIELKSINVQFSFDALYRRIPM